MSGLLDRRVAAFILVGAVGFVVDGGLLTLLSQMLAINLYLARLFSFATATLATWMLNRKFAFKVQAGSVQQKQAEYLRYMLVQIGGALSNLGIFSLLILAHSELKDAPVVPLAVGALFGLIFNYSGSRYWVFRPSSFLIKRE